jgi:hypothetical protein
MLATSKVLSQYFVVLHEPNAGVAENDYPQFNYAALRKALTAKKQQSEDPK